LLEPSPEIATTTAAFDETKEADDGVVEAGEEPAA